ncbi:ATP-binding protein [Thermodesulfobacteriota bacterium]
MKNRLFLFFTSIVVYCIAFIIMAKTVKIGTPTVALIPAVAAGWLFGLWPGIIVGALSFPVNALLLIAVGLGIDQLLSGGGIAGTTAIIFVAAVIGRMRDLRTRLNTELQQRRRVELELKQHRDNLDRLVQDKTFELQAANTALHEEIKQRKLTEKELTKLAAAVEQANDIIMIFDAAGEVTYVNPALESTIGYSAKEVVGTNLISRDKPPDKKSLFQNAWKTISKGTVWNGHMQTQNKDGATLDLIITITPIRDQAGEITGHVSIGRNVTKELEMEARLRRAEKMEALGTLAGGVAHDLNNTLGAIVGYPDLLLKNLPEDSAMRKSILAIKHSGERAAAIVQDLLTLARRGVQTAKVININTVVTTLLESREYKKLLEYHPAVTLETHLAGDLLNISGSPFHLSKTILNLLSNAAEALVNGGTITIATENRYVDKKIKSYDTIKEGDYTVLTVKDTGMGIRSEDVNKIFEPFYTKKTMGRSGTGLGMAVVWGTIKDHQGYIDVESTEGRGTIFTLYFPATRQGVQSTPGPLALEDYAGTGEKILVVDDVALQREIAVNLLKELNYTVAAVASGEEAIEHLKTRPVDLVVLDMIMDPGLDGLDTYKKILEIHPGQKAIIASGFSETSRVKEAQKLGTGTYISKPYTLEKIGLAIKSTLAG